MLNPLLKPSEELVSTSSVYFAFSVGIFYVLPFIIRFRSLEFSSGSQFTGLPGFLNAFTFAQSTHAPLTPLSHSPADEEVEDDDVEDEDDENNEDEKKEEGVDADCNCNCKH